MSNTLSGWTFGRLLSSPLLRARETARLAGFEVELDQDLMEWDYGELEGLHNDEITAQRPGWSKWRDEIPGGEQVDAVGTRADRFLSWAPSGVGTEVDSDILVFAHGHLLSIMVARWLGLDASKGRHFPLATATVSVLSMKRSDPVLETLNRRCGPQLDAEVIPY